MGRKNGNEFGKLEKHEKTRKKKKDKAKRNFELNGKYTQKGIRKQEANAENQKKSKTRKKKK